MTDREIHAAGATVTYNRAASAVEDESCCCGHPSSEHKGADVCRFEDCLCGGFDPEPCPHCEAEVPLWRTEYGTIHMIESTGYSRTTIACSDPDVDASDRVGPCSPWEKIR